MNLKLRVPVNCEMCEKAFEPALYSRRAGRGRFCSSQCWADSKSRMYLLNRRWLRKTFLKPVCEQCGFVAEHRCQLDLDHKDGNALNHKQENLQTLCANCHRLKTLKAKDGRWKGYRVNGEAHPSHFEYPL